MSSFNPSDASISYNSGTTYKSNAVVTTGNALLHDCSGYNSGSTTFIQLYNSATVPANGVAAEMEVVVAGQANFSFNIPESKGRLFNNGISWADSSTSPTKTLNVAANVYLTCSYDLKPSQP